MRLVTYILLSLTIGLSLVAMDQAPIGIEKEFAYLQSQSDIFFTNLNKTIYLPITNRMKSFVERAENKSHVKKQIVEDARNTVVLIDPRVLLNYEKYFTSRKENGTDAEKKLYSTMNFPGFVYRLIKNRPLTFYSSDDRTLLRPDYFMKYPQSNKKMLNPEQPTNRYSSKGIEFFKNAKNHFEALTDYLCYDEIALAALLGLSCPTFFINDGDRNNYAELGAKGSYESHGTYRGLVGARFEQPGLMERRHIMIVDPDSPQDDASEKGNKDDLDFWQALYGIPFLTGEKIKKLSPDEYGKRFFKYTDYHFDKNIYKKRMEFPIREFLTRPKECKKTQTVYAHVVGLGLGAWAKNEIEQAQCILEVFANIIQNDKNGDFAHISDLNFSWFPDAVQEIAGIKNGEKLNHITIHFSKRNPAYPLTGEDAGKLLVAMYAWDGGSYIGNEYWISQLNLSGDPAAVCCSLIGELQNPLINGHYIFMSILDLIAKHMPDKTKEMKLLMKKTQAEYRAKIEEFAKSHASVVTNIPQLGPNPESSKGQAYSEAKQKAEAAWKMIDEQEATKKAALKKSIQEKKERDTAALQAIQEKKEEESAAWTEYHEKRRAAEKAYLERKNKGEPSIWQQLASGTYSLASSLLSSASAVISGISSGIWNIIQFFRGKK